MPVEIRFLDFDKEDTGEVIGMALDEQFESLVVPLIPEEWRARLPTWLQDATPALLAFVLKKYVLKPARGELMETVLRGIMKKNIAEVVKVRMFKPLG